MNHVCGKCCRIMRKMQRNLKRTERVSIWENNEHKGYETKEVNSSCTAYVCPNCLNIVFYGHIHPVQESDAQ